MATTCTAAGTAGAPPSPELAASLALLPLWTPLALPGLAHPGPGIFVPTGTATAISAATAEAGSVHERQIGGMAPTRRLRFGRGDRSIRTRPGHPYPKSPPVSINQAGRPHVPLRPLWLCRSCTAPWPCLTARNRLPVEYRADPVGLHLYLAAMLQAAIDDLYRLEPDPGPDPAIMYARFLAWARPRLLITRARLGVDAGGNRCRPRGGPSSAEPPADDQTAR